MDKRATSVRRAARCSGNVSQTHCSMIWNLISDIFKHTLMLSDYLYWSIESATWIVDTIVYLMLSGTKHIASSQQLQSTNIVHRLIWCVDIYLHTFTVYRFNGERWAFRESLMNFLLLASWHAHLYTHQTIFVVRMVRWELVCIHENANANPN